MAQLIEKKRLVGILRGFDFAKVQRVMEQTDAKWLREDGRNEVPSIYDMVVQCEQLLESLYDNLQKGKSCEIELEIRYGGFCARYSDGRFSLHYEIECSEELEFAVPAEQ
jgi:hypothetical protein